MRSDEVTKNAERAPHRSLFKAMGYTDEELSRPLIGIANPRNEIVPGHFNLDQLSEAVKAGIRIAGGTPIEFGTIGVCDGIAMGHKGMHYSLASRAMAVRCSTLLVEQPSAMSTASAFAKAVSVRICEGRMSFLTSSTTCMPACLARRIRSA